MPQDITAAVAAASFWLFVAAVVVAAIVTSAFRHRETQKTIRQVIERGQTLDSETLERLLSADRPPPPNPAGLLIGGLVLACLGGGLALMGWIASASTPGMLYPMLGVGALVAMLGLALLIGSAFVRNVAGRR
jgi:hypothetical protein